MNKAHNKKEIISTILKFNLVIGVYNLYLYAVGQSLFNLVIGWYSSIKWRKRKLFFSPDVISSFFLLFDINSLMKILSSSFLGSIE